MPIHQAVPARFLTAPRGDVPCQAVRAFWDSRSRRRATRAVDRSSSGRVEVGVQMVVRRPGGTSGRCRPADRRAFWQATRSDRLCHGAALWRAPSRVGRAATPADRVRGAAPTRPAVRSRARRPLDCCNRHPRRRAARPHDRLFNGTPGLQVITVYVGSSSAQHVAGARSRSQRIQRTIVPRKPAICGSSGTRLHMSEL